MSLVGRIALITGGGSGIGRAVCKRFAQEGARVAVADVHAENAVETTKLLPDSAQHLTCTTDVSSASSVASTLQMVQKHFDQVPSIAVNCAGITSDQFLLKMDDKDFDKVIDINLKGTYLVTKAVAQLMVQQKLPGSIVNISSLVAKTGNLGQSNYAASKAGVVGFTKTVAKELGQFGIRCNVVLPGFIETPMVESIPEKVIARLIPMIPAGRMGKPEDIAEACLFLASDKSSYVTGTTLEVTGGLNA